VEVDIEAVADPDPAILMVGEGTGYLEAQVGKEILGVLENAVEVAASFNY